MKATHDPMKAIVGYQEVNLEPGQFIFGRRKAAEEIGLSEREIRTCIDSLNTRQNLTIKATNKFSIISIMNWGTYQNSNFPNDPQSDQQPTSNRPHTRTKEQKKKTLRDPSDHAVSPGFRIFYSAYPKKRARGNAERAWKKLNPDADLQGIILTTLEKQKRSEDWRKDGGKFIPYPATWLNGRRWEDEIPEETKSRWTY